MKKEKIDLSIIISTFNTKKLLKKTLLSIFKVVKGISFEIIVVDDGSKDDTVEMIKKNFLKVKIIRNKNNLGYSKSYNLGTKLAEGKLVLHLNSDVQFLNNSSFKKAISYMKNNADVGIIGCKIIKPNGNLDLPCKRSSPTPMNIFFQSIGLAKIFPKSKIFGNYYLTYLNENEINEVDCIMGAFMLIKKEVIKEIGYLDENFFIYGEDIDYCYRVKNSGRKVVYFPAIQIKHLHGGTTNNFQSKYIWHFHHSMFQYYNKHFAKNTNFLFNTFIYSGITIRFIMVLSINFLTSNFTFIRRK